MSVVAWTAGVGVETITSAGDIDALFKQGKRASGKLLAVLCAHTPPGRPPPGRLLFVAGRKTGGAVKRNRCKRVMREAVRRCGGPWPGMDVALVARPAVADAAPGEVDEAVEHLVERARALL